MNILDTDNFNSELGSGSDSNDIFLNPPILLFVVRTYKFWNHFGNLDWIGKGKGRKSKKKDDSYLK